MTNIYDFSNLDDLPEELKDRVTRAGAQEPDWVQDLEGIVVNAPRPIKLSQILIAAHRSGVELPTEQTVRNWLNKLEEAGRVTKPTRATYFGPGEAPEVQEVSDESLDQAESDAAVEAEDDPLGLDDI